MRAICFDSLSLRADKPNYVQIRIESIGAQTETSTVVFSKTVSLPVAVLILLISLPILVPALILLFIVVLIRFIVSPTEIEEPSYEQAKAYFAQGNGYLASLSEEQKQELMRKKEDLPLNL